MLTQKQLKECLHYNPDTGVFTWKVRPISHFKTARDMNRWNNRYSGTDVGHKHKDGPRRYREVHIFKKCISAHRLAFLYMTGKFPQNKVDHNNGDGLDNRWLNLSDVSNSENGRNQRKSCINTSGVTGVFWDKESLKWRAGIGVNKKKIYLGRYNCITAAEIAVKAARIKYGFNERHGT